MTAQPLQKGAFSMVENFDDKNFDNWVVAYADGRKAALDLENYADSLKDTEAERRAADLFFKAFQTINYNYKHPQQNRIKQAISIIRERFYQP